MHRYICSVHIASRQRDLTEASTNGRRDGILDVSFHIVISIRRSRSNMTYISHKLSSKSSVHSHHSLVRWLEDATSMINLSLINDGHSRAQLVVPVAKHGKVVGTLHAHAIFIDICSSHPNITGTYKYRTRGARADWVPAWASHWVLRKTTPDSHHRGRQGVLLGGNIGSRVRAEHERDLARMEDPEIRERLRVGERCIEVVPPGWNAHRGAVVGEHGSCALEDVFGEDLGYLIVVGVDARGSKRVCCLNEITIYGHTARELIDEGSGCFSTVLANFEDAGKRLVGRTMMGYGAALTVLPEHWIRARRGSWQSLL